MTVVGVGHVTFLKDHEHVLSVCGARVHLSNVRVTDGGKYELGYGALSVEGSAGWLTLSKCIVEDTCEVGIIAGREGVAPLRIASFAGSVGRPWR